MEPRLKMSDVQLIYRKSYRTIERWIKHRGLPAFKIGKEYHFIQHDLELWETKQKLGLAGDKFDTDIEVDSFSGNASGSRILPLAGKRVRK